VTYFPLLYFQLIQLIYNFKIKIKLQH